MEKKHEAWKTFTAEERGVYLDDVLYALRNQNWTTEEEPCLNETLLVLQNLKNFTLQSVWQWDSISSEPQGLLYGNRYHLGNFDQCIEAPWYDTYPNLRNQYCLADIVLERSDKTPRKRVKEFYNPYQSALDLIEHRSLFMRPLNYLTWGLCVPSSCQPQSVQRLLGILLAQSHIGAAGLRARITVNEPCQSVDKPREYDALFYSFIGVMTFFAAVILICTYIRHQRSVRDTQTLGDEIIKAICLKSNAQDLLKINKGGNEVFYGIRFLNICFIVLDHQFGMANGGPISNGAQVDKAALSIMGLLILHNDLFVDTFFLLSGFLAATGLSAFKRFPNPFILILKRYVRLATAFAVVIFYVCAIYPFTGSGPLWNRAIASDTDQCRKNWWISLLMLNNYIDSENICMVVTWYIPCDFHFFTVTMLLYWLYRTHARLGITCAVVVSIAAIITPGIVNYLNQLPPIQLFTYDFLTNPRSLKQFHLTYIKSHTRYASYLVGFYSGLIFTLLKSFLSWYPWVPLSRLSYGLYLTHAIIITRNVFSTRVSQHADIFFFLIQTAGVIVWGCLASLIILVLVELPVNNLISLCFKKRSNLEDNQPKIKENHQHRNIEAGTGIENAGFMQENLISPTKIVVKF
ncbi:unnamed protein product [Parnassius apollo]|uniref:(apollo) hypothetical protein n=1 Tax=Parnassius apollo TaxID=110799 RepID=A0A8S3WCT5_PARAO|nr:unnamed protein product [Parnassius apollo]